MGKLAQEYYDHQMEASPSWAHMLGDYRFADRFEDGSRAAEDRFVAGLRSFAERARAIPDEGLAEQDRVTRDFLAFDATTHADVLERRLAELAVDPVFGNQTAIPVTFAQLGLPTVEVAEAMVGKLEGVGQSFRDTAERHREGVASGRTPASFAVEDAIAQIEKWLGTPLSEDPLLAAVADPPEGLDVQAWREKLTRAVETSVRPGLEEFRDVLRDEVRPVMRSDDRCGLSWLPDGDESYAASLVLNTTTELSAQEIHDIGLQKIAELEEEYRALGSEVFGTDDVQEIYTRLRDDAALHYDTAEEIRTDCEKAFAKARAAMPEWFGRLPQSDCTVKTTDMGALAYYFPPAEDGTRGGTFYVNVSDPAHWGRYEIEALAFHEGIPGHHLQIAIATELTDLPAFRRFTHVNAYAEGWGLYTERLADEMGLYSGPLERLGMLTMDSMRAGRLVVDTGLHALGWGRQQAVDYLAANCPMSLAAVRAEIDRYAVWPGQACGYMIGRLELLRMRDEAQQRQGEAFDIKAFHDAVLDSGSLPLAILDDLLRTRLP